MMTTFSSSGAAEMNAALGENRLLIIYVAIFSAVVNTLMLSGPLFMLQVYDRVLVARSGETLLSLFLLIAGLFMAMGMLDHVRNRIMVRIAARFQTHLESRVFTAALERRRTRPGDPVATAGLRDLDAVSRFLAAPVFLAIFDAPWTFLFLGAIFAFHPWLGFLALSGGVLLLVITWASQIITAPRILRTLNHQRRADHLADRLHEESDIIGALGMRPAVLDRWKAVRAVATESLLSTADATGRFNVFSRTFRLFLQSAMLALGACVVLNGDMTPGAMIAASILMGRALAPIEKLIVGWPILIHGHAGWIRLRELLDAVPEPTPRTELPRPQGSLDVENLDIVPPNCDAATLRKISFSVRPGRALGIIGPSGSGKSTLARALCATWPATAGTVRLDGATIDQYPPDLLGRIIGYLPQRVTLFNGTVAENIARLSPTPNADAIVAATKRADAHQMILDLPDGYDTMLTPTGEPLSGGQIQRIGLARALYGDPVLLVLDEPNASLDCKGERALNGAIRDAKRAGAAVIVMAHHPAAITECETLMILENGTCLAYGPRENVLRATVRNAGDIPRATGALA